MVLAASQAIAELMDRIRMPAAQAGKGGEHCDECPNEECSTAGIGLARSWALAA